MKFSSDVPTIPGWYWERDGHGCVVIRYLPHCHVWPKHWYVRRLECINQALEDKEFDTAKKLENIATKEWFVEWAGPLIPPE